MTIPLTTPALLFPAIAILMLGYVNRYVSVAGVIRGFKKDYDTGYKHARILDQISVLHQRIELIRYMLSIGAMALLLACLSMFLIFEGYEDAGGVAFGASLVAMILTTVLSVYETSLSNRSLIIEIEDIRKKEASKKS